MMLAPRKSHLLGAAALALLLSCAGSSIVQAASVADTTLETELADEIATGLIETYNGAAYAAPGFETFERLFEAYESLRKWQAYLDAMSAARLPVTAGPYARIKAAVDRLHAASIDASALAASAIEALRGLGDWHANDKAQSDLVIQHLGKLVTELGDPRQRLLGQSVLAEVELASDAPMAAAARIVAATADIRRLGDSRQQLQFATQFATMLQSLDAPRTIEIVSEITAAIGAANDRQSFIGGVAGGFTGKSSVRLSTASADFAAGNVADPLALAWAAHLSGGGLDPSRIATAVGGGVDPLPVLIAIAADVPPKTRQEICRTLVDKLIADGSAIRALNLTKRLGAADCGPATALTLAASFATQGLDGLADPLLEQFFASISIEKQAATPEQLSAAAQTLEILGDVARLDARASLLRPALGDELVATTARAAIRALLLDRHRLSQPIGIEDRAAIDAYAPAARIYGLLSGEATAAGMADASAADLDLMRDVGRAMAGYSEGCRRLLQFVAGDAPLADRLAAAAGYTSDLGFNAADTTLTATLRPLTETSEPGGDAASLLASLGALDPASLGNATERDALLRRAARQRAWSGDFDGALASTKAIGDPQIASGAGLDIASVQAVAGSFEDGVAQIRAYEDTPTRIAAFRFVARERAERLDIHDWIDGSEALDLAPAQIIKASVADGDGPVIHYDDRLNVRASGAALPTGKPALPDLDVTSSDVTSAVPFPNGGAAGIVVGGEGRYVRLGGFDSPYFDGESNNGVRDYVYEQNRTITPEFIFLNGGTFTIADIIDAIGRDQAGAIDLLPDGVVRFNRPIAIGSDAALILSGDEAREIQLNATTGAFIVNAGHLSVVGVRVVGYDVDKGAEVRRGYEASMHKFRPFLLSWSGSQTNLADSEFVALGYSAGRSYGVTMNTGPVDDYYVRAHPQEPTGIVVNNSFDNLYYGFYAYEATDVQLVGNEYRNSIIYGIDPHDRSKRLNISLNTAYGTSRKHGIIISREVNDSFIVGNLSFDNHGSGTMLDRSSIGTLVFANTLRGNHGDGMAVFESPCTIIGMNDVSSNNRAGIKVRNSWDVLLLQNLISENKGSAVEGFISDLTVSDGSAGRNFALDPYQPVAGFTAIGNTIRGNGAGIQVAGVSEMELYGNQFRNQSGRLVAGDLEGLQGVLLQQAERQPTLIATNCKPVLQPMHACPFTELGLIAASRFSTGDTGDFCLGDAGTAQAHAFSAVAP